MELAVELLAKILERREITVSFPTLDLTAKDLLESASYQALCQRTTPSLIRSAFKKSKLLFRLWKIWA